MWAKLKKGERNVRVTVRVPISEWEKFREHSQRMTASEATRAAYKLWIRENPR